MGGGWFEYFSSFYAESLGVPSPSGSIHAVPSPRGATQQQTTTKIPTPLLLTFSLFEYVESLRWLLTLQGLYMRCPYPVGLPSNKKQKLTPPPPLLIFNLSEK